MRILHYSLGLPPYARGGLTKYAIDLIGAEQKLGYQVGLLWPGRMECEKGNPLIKSCSLSCGIENYEIINPLPLPQIYGIRDFVNYMISCDDKGYASFLQSYSPDVIHLHTLMGLHKEFLQVAHEMKIRLVFTSHDYFGICPKSTLFYNGETCDSNLDCINCWECCANALSIKKTMLLQSALYRKLKNSFLVIWLRRQKKKQLIDRTEMATSPSVEYCTDYLRLRKYYMDMFTYLDKIHFNSRYTRMLYHNYFNPKDEAVISITHKDICSRKKIKDTPLDIVRFTYVGAIAEYKGFYVLLHAMDELFDSGGTNFELHVYSEVAINKEYVKVHQPYVYGELASVMEQTDMMIVPLDVSFGFTVLEALSYGVPVLTTCRVGASDLVEHETTGLIGEYSIEGLKKELIKVLKYPEMLRDFNRTIVKNTTIKQIDEHALEIIEQLYNK